MTAMYEPQHPSPAGGPASPLLVDRPAYRRNVDDFLRQAQRIPHITGTGEADVTEALRRIGRLQRRARVGLSLNAYLAYLLGRAAQRHPEVQAVHIPFSRQVATFAGVDVNTIIEQRSPGRAPVIVSYIIRDADRKSLAAICREMRTASKRDLLETDDRAARLMRLARYPAPVRRLFWRWVDLDPARRRRFRGTIGLTNLNVVTVRDAPIFGHPVALLTTSLCVGSLYERLVPSDEDPHGFRRSKRLCLTLQCDHRLVDGAPMARFARTFYEALARGDGLDDDLAEQLAAPAPQPAAATHA